MSKILNCRVDSKREEWRDIVNDYLLLIILDGEALKTKLLKMQCGMDDIMGISRALLFLMV